MVRASGPPLPPPQCIHAGERAKLKAKWKARKEEKKAELRAARLAAKDAKTAAGGAQAPPAVAAAAPSSETALPPTAVDGCGKGQGQQAKGKGKESAAAAGEEGGRGGDPAPEPELCDMTAWKEFALHPLLEHGLALLGFSQPTEVQRQCLPAAVRDRLDVIGAAQTGSGKTLAFGLPIMQLLMQVGVGGRGGVEGLQLCGARCGACLFLPLVDRISLVLGGL